MIVLPTDLSCDASPSDFKVTGWDDDALISIRPASAARTAIARDPEP